MNEFIYFCTIFDIYILNIKKVFKIGKDSWKMLWNSTYPISHILSSYEIMNDVENASSDLF